ncbi:MAG: site-specific DNA-methyltransferase [Bacteroidales bacterium]
MTTEHLVLNSDSRRLDQITGESVGLVVTSPPYPMIEMWDEVLFNQNIKIKEAFNQQEYEHAFEMMHQELDKVWQECFRVLKPGGFACINIGDATRTLSCNFRLFSNHSRILSGCLQIGFQNLPNIIWRKQTNAPNKFMGSGMLPAGAYVTLEHEFILVFRKGEKREFKKEIDKENRQKSAFFWEERNSWFSDIWELKGTKQLLLDEASRKRSAAFPYGIPYRLINMYSVANDVILDPFVGTGTSILAAIGSRRNSIGVEIEPSFNEIITKTVLGSENFLNDYNQERLNNHIDFVKNRNTSKGEVTFKYQNEYYHFPVMTRQELKMQLPFVKNIVKNDGKIIANYRETTELLNFNKDSLFN